MGDLLDDMAECASWLRGKLLLGLSGGADSVALLLILARLREKGLVTLAAVHVNHGLRGEASDGDEAFVRRLCGEKRVPLICCRADPPPHPGENWAREARYGFFRQAMAETGADALALAHHQGDQAETLLMHLMRGAGLDGLRGMSPETDAGGLRIVRPLLSLTRETLRDMLREENQSWRDDASNDDTAYLRNAVRAQLLPLMEKLSPGAAGRVASCAALVQGDCDTLSRMEETFLARYAGPDWMLLSPLLAQNAGFRARLVRRWWRNGPGGGMDERGLSREQTAALCALADGRAGQRCNLPGGYHGERGWSCLHLTGAKLPVPPPVAAVSGAALLGVTLTMLPGGDDPGDGKRWQEIPRDMMASCVLRTRREGDWIRPFGAAGKQSLQDYLVNRRVDAAFRDRVPLLCRGGEVLLVCGVGCGGIPRWAPGTDSVRLHWAGDMPWANNGEGNGTDGTECEAVR